MKQIKLTRNLMTLVDDEDFETLSRFKWFADSAGYAARSVYFRKAKNKYGNRKIYMHRQLLGFPKNKEVDHINGIIRDNQKHNLRVVSHSVNMKNRKSVPGSTSCFTGVHLHKQSGKFRAQIRYNGRTVSLGLFDSEIQALEARVRFVKIHGGGYLHPMY